MGAGHRLATTATNSNKMILLCAFRDDKKLEAMTLCRDCSYDKRVELDANYVSDWRFSTDLSILARTGSRRDFLLIRKSPGRDLSQMSTNPRNLKVSGGRRYRAEGKLLTVPAPISLARDLCTPKQKAAVSLAKDFADYPARTGATKRVSLKSGGRANLRVVSRFRSCQILHLPVFHEK